MSDESKSRLFLPSRVRLLFLLFGAVAYVVTETGRFWLRPLVHETGFNDYGLSGIIGNGGGILVQMFLGFAIINPTHRQSYWLSLLFIGGYILYEFTQLGLLGGTFDWNDIWATLIGGGIGLLILKLIWKRFPSD